MKYLYFKLEKAGVELDPDCRGWRQNQELSNTSGSCEILEDMPDDSRDLSPLIILAPRVRSWIRVSLSEFNVRLHRTSQIVLWICATANRIAEELFGLARIRFRIRQIRLKVRQATTPDRRTPI